MKKPLYLRKLGLTIAIWQVHGGMGWKQAWRLASAITSKIEEDLAGRGASTRAEKTRRQPCPN